MPEFIRLPHYYFNAVKMKCSYSSKLAIPRYMHKTNIAINYV